MKWLFILFTFILFFSNCDLSFLGLNTSRQYSIISPEDSISNIPTGDFFYLNIKSAYYTGAQGSFDPLDFLIYAMDEGPGTDCKISVNEESATEDLYCMFEISEGDLWFHEINLEYNVPPGMCSYLAFMPHWHYNQPTGRPEDPSEVYECYARTRTSESGELTKEKKHSLSPPIGIEKICNPEKPYKEKAEDLCPYNRSSEKDSGLANCCYGSYRLIGEKENIKP